MSDKTFHVKGSLTLHNVVFVILAENKGKALEKMIAHDWDCYVLNTAEAVDWDYNGKTLEEAE